MLETDNRADIEIQFLEDLFEHEIECAYQHGHTVCTMKVTHLLSSTCNSESIGVCEIAAKAKEREILQVGKRCISCGRAPDECWTIRPI